MPIRSGDRRLMMPNERVSQPVADPPPGPGVRPASTPPSPSRREVFTGVWSRRLARQRAALRRTLSPMGTAARSPGAGRNRRQSSRKGAQR
jgi:hypothetical protein